MIYITYHHQPTIYKGNMKALTIILTLVMSLPALALDKLDTDVRMMWPENIDTNGELIDYFLQPHGYTFIETGSTSSKTRSARITMLPTGEPIKIKDLLLDLVPRDVNLVIDSSSRRITYVTDAEKHFLPKRKKIASIDSGNNIEPVTNSPLTIKKSTAGNKYNSFKYVIKKGNSMGSIAEKVKTRIGGSHRQRIVTIYALNSDSFKNGNINLLAEGDILEIPEAIPTNLTKDAAHKAYLELINNKPANWYSEAQKSIYYFKHNNIASTKEPTKSTIVSNPVKSKEEEIAQLRDQIKELMKKIAKLNQEISNPLATS